MYLVGNPYIELNDFAGPRKSDRMTFFHLTRDMGVAIEMSKALIKGSMLFDTINLVRPMPPGVSHMDMVYRPSSTEQCELGANLRRYD